ncbi:MAG: hypothetical protein F2667_09125, partial [Actinobacteria bacterium]|nr:hypothetical protein [Actinomycetota bacterium]
MTIVDDTFPTLDRVESELDSAGPSFGLLELVTDGACALGFQIAALAVRRDTGEFEYVAVSGYAEVRAEMIGSHLTLARLGAELEVAE